MSAKKAVEFDLVGRLIAYECGELPKEKTIELFQYLVDTDLVWSLQGHYGRTAQRFIDGGLVTKKGQKV